MCTTLQAALAELDAHPGRARCIAERGQQLARSLTMDRVHAYMAEVLRKSAMAQTTDVVRRQLAEANGAEHVVTKRNLIRHVSDSTRPWIEHVFLPSNGGNLSRTWGAGALPPKRGFLFSR